MITVIAHLPEDTDGAEKWAISCIAGPNDPKFPTRVISKFPDGETKQELSNPETKTAWDYAEEWKSKGGGLIGPYDIFPLAHEPPVPDFFFTRERNELLEEETIVKRRMTNSRDGMSLSLK